MIMSLGGMDANTTNKHQQDSFEGLGLTPPIEGSLEGPGSKPPITSPLPPNTRIKNGYVEFRKQRKGVKVSRSWPLRHQDIAVRSISCLLSDKEQPLTEFVACELCTGRGWSDVCDGCDRRRKRLYRLRVKLETFNAYGGALCSCCGESQLQFLSIDHIFNDGAAERRKWRSGGYPFYLSLKKQGFPQGRYRVLCMNCQQGRKLNAGVCPHKQQEAA